MPSSWFALSEVCPLHVAATPACPLHRSLISSPLPRASNCGAILTDPAAGVLVECDPSIKSIIIAIDAERNEYIIEDLDESHLVIQERMVPQLKKMLEEVRQSCPALAVAPRDSRTARPPLNFGVTARLTRLTRLICTAPC